MRRLPSILALIILVLASVTSAVAQTPLTGTKTVGSGGDYTDIKSAFDAINTNGVSGDLILQIISDQTLTASATLNDFGNSASVTIYPTGNYEISGALGNSNSGIIQLNGCSNVILDGSLNGAGGNRSLWLNNTSNFSTAVKFLGASDIQIKNCRLSTGVTTGNPSSAYAIRMYYSDGFCDNILIDNNLIDRGYYGIYVYGSINNNKHTNIRIVNNEIYPGYMYYGVYCRYINNLVFNHNNIKTDNYMYYMTNFYYVHNLEANYNKLEGTSTYNPNTYYPYYGLYCNYLSGDIEINNNDISKVSYGIRVYYSRNEEMGEIAYNIVHDITYYGLYAYNSSYEPAGGYNIHHNEISNIQKRQNNASTSSIVGMYFGYMDPCKIHDNYIHDIINNYDGESLYPGYTAGIYLYGNSTKSSDNMKIYNNRIHSITSRSTNYNSPQGYYFHYMPAGILGHTAKNLEIYQNTIYMDLPFTNGGVPGGKSSCITLGGFYAESSGNTIKNNILVNEMVGDSTEAYCIYLPLYNNHINSVGTSDYNLLSCPNGAIVANDGTNSIYSDLSSWQAAGYGANSINAEVSLTPDCHIDGSLAVSNDILCPQITSLNIPLDVDGEARTDANNRMGADITNASLAIVQDLSLNPDYTSYCIGLPQLDLQFIAEVQFADSVARSMNEVIDVQWYHNDQIIESNIDSNLTLLGQNLMFNNLTIENEGDYYAICSVPNLDTVITSTKSIEITAPVAIAQDIDVYLNADGVATIEATDIDNGSYSNCEDIVLSVDISSFDCDDLGENTVVLTATGLNSGKTSEANAIVTVLDTIAPTITLELDETMLWPPNNQMRTITATVTASDNCGVENIYLESVIDVNDTGNNIENAATGTEDYVFDLRANKLRSKQYHTYTITYSAEDASGNRAEVSEDVRVSNRHWRIKLVTDGQQIPDFDFAISPNPAETEITLSFDSENDEVVEIAIFDIMGNQMQKYNLSSSLVSEQIDISSLQSGTYQIRIVTNNSVVWKRFVKL